MNFIPLSQLLHTARPDAYPVALRHGATIPFATFHADIAAATNHFTQWQRVALTCTDSYHFAVALLGAMHAGCTAILPANNKPATLAALAAEFDAVIDDARMEELPAAALTPRPIDRDAHALHFYTSGSTGAPKKIIKTWRMLENEAAGIEALWAVTSGSGPVLSTVPHQHLYCLAFKLLWPLSSGRMFEAETHVLWESALASLTTDSILVSSPAHLERLGGIAPQPLKRIPSRIFSAGAPLTLGASHDAERVLGRLPTEIFGSSETGAIATRQQRDANEVWHPLPEIRITQNAEQRMVVASPFIGAEPFLTDDLIELTTDGFHFLGRADRTVKIEGKRINLIDIERQLHSLPLVAKAATAMLPGEKKQLVTAIILNDEGRVTLHSMGNFRFERHLRKMFGELVEAAGIPRRWRFVENFSANPLGKYSEQDILALFSEAA